MTTLATHMRGDTFRYSFTLGNGWLGSDFTGGVKFTLRRATAKSTQVDDSGAIDQASVATGEIAFAGAGGAIEIPASRTTRWPGDTVLIWDLQGVISAPEPLVYTIDSGQIQIRSDVTRSV